MPNMRRANPVQFSDQGHGCWQAPDGALAARSCFVRSGGRRRSCSPVQRLAGRECPPHHRRPRPRRGDRHPNWPKCPPQAYRSARRDETIGLCCFGSWRPILWVRFVDPAAYEPSFAGELSLAQSKKGAQLCPRKTIHDAFEQALRETVIDEEGKYGRLQARCLLVDRQHLIGDGSAVAYLQDDVLQAT